MRQVRENIATGSRFEVLDTRSVAGRPDRVRLRCIFAARGTADQFGAEFWASVRHVAALSKEWKG